MITALVPLCWGYTCVSIANPEIDAGIFIYEGAFLSSCRLIHKYFSHVTAKISNVDACAYIASQSWILKFCMCIHTLAAD